MRVGLGMGMKLWGWGKVHGNGMAMGKLLGDWGGTGTVILVFTCSMLQFKHVKHSPLASS